MEPKSQEELRLLLAQGEDDKVVKYFRSQINKEKNKGFRNQIIRLSSEWSEHRKKVRAGTHKEEDLARDRALIRQGLMDLIDQLEEEPIGNRPANSGIRINILVAAGILAMLSIGAYFFLPDYQADKNPNDAISESKIDQADTAQQRNELATANAGQVEESETEKPTEEEDKRVTTSPTGRKEDKTTIIDPPAPTEEKTYQYTISGRVLANNEALQDVSVRVEGSSVETFTDKYGKYWFKLPEKFPLSNLKLVFTKDDYKRATLDEIIQPNDFEVSFPNISLEPKNQ